MFSYEPSRAVENFAALVLPLSEKDLEREWIWKDHGKEGIRFAFFVTLQELPHLAPRGCPLSVSLASTMQTTWICKLRLSVYLLRTHRAPAEGEWPIRRIYAHIFRAEINSKGTVRYALERHHARTWTPQGMSDEDAVRLVGMSEEENEALLTDPLEEVLAYHREFHPRILKDFSTISDSELDLPSTFWEETRFPISHRLNCYEAHYAQHTVQIDMIFVAIGRAPGESKRLSRKIYAGLAEAEGMPIGTEKSG